MNKLKKLQRKIVILLLFFAFIQVNAQTIEGYSFQNYSVKKHSFVKKAKLNFQSNPSASIFKKWIIEGYEKSKDINFGGYYVLISWKMGTDSMEGVLVDSRDGKIYNLPPYPRTTGNNCYQDREELQKITYTASSKLFITTACKEFYIEENKEYKQEKIFYMSLWNEQYKKFELIKEVKKIKIVKE